MALSIYDDSGASVGAVCSIDRVTERQWTVTIESRGGTIGGDSERNPGYAQGFQIVLRRLAQAHAVLESATIESQSLIRRGLSPLERRLLPEGISFPMQLIPSSVDEVTRRLRSAQAAVGTLRTQGGGNTTRRVQLLVRLLADSEHAGHLASMITGSTESSALADFQVSASAEHLSASGDFDPQNILDARARTLTTIARRQGQPRFRQALMTAYEGQCMVCRSDASAVLEAAHIMPYRGALTNHVQNGLLLRSDFHTLFDRGLFGIDPQSWKVVLHNSLMASSYKNYSGMEVVLPAKAGKRPSREALEVHLYAAGLR